MLGHPQETDEDLEELLEFVRRQRFERLGAFAFSNEEGTFAFENYGDNIAQEEKERRVAEVMALQQQISAEINEKKIGQHLKTVIDRRQDEFYIGRTEFDSPEVDGEVLIAASPAAVLQTGEFYNVKITAATEYDLTGEV